MANIFVHIGLHKTGTTSLQQFFAANEPAFNRQGIYFPRATRESRPQQIIHSNLSWELMMHDLFDPELGRLEDVVNEIHAHPEREIWVITGEGLSRLKTPSKLLKMLADHRVTVVVYLRNPVSLAPSLYTEQLKFGSHYTFDEWIECRAGQWLNQELIMAPWRRFAMTRLQRWLYRMGVRRPLWWSGSNNRTRVVERSLSELSGSPWNLMEDFNDLVGVTNVDDFKFVKGSQSNARISNIECIGLVFINNLLAGRGGLRGKEKVDTLRRFRSAIVQKFGGNTEPFVSTKSQNARLQELGRKSWKITKLREPDGSEAGRDLTAVSSAISQITTWLAAYAAADFTNEEVSFACERVVQFAFEQEMVTSGVKEDKPRR